jgi:hypothetical protein
VREALFLLLGGALSVLANLLFSLGDLFLNLGNQLSYAGHLFLKTTAPFGLFSNETIVCHRHFSLCSSAEACGSWCVLGGIDQVV